MKKPPKRLPRISPKRLAAHGGTMPFSTITPKARKPIAKRNEGKRAKRRKRNADYYASPEWRAKKKAVHKRDGYQCTEKVRVRRVLCFEGEELAAGTYSTRCPNRGEIVNGKQTARGLVAEETSYFHRGTEGSIDKIVTRCKDCDRRLTPLERANHAQGFQK